MTDASRLDLPTEEVDAIARAIASDQSPVGIDAKKTHAVILHLLLDLQDRLARLEARLGAE
jgi:hypothetical protein